MRRYLLGFILALGFLVRILGVSSYPTGFTPDEASFGYDAYSLLKTGKDQWAQSFPLIFRSFGDFKLPLYVYLSTIPVKIFGLTEFAVRLPAVFFGTLAILATYLLVLELFLVSKERYKVALLSALLLALSPWHISLSRGAFEANLTSFFLSFGIYSFLRGLKNPAWFIFSSLTFGLNLFSYHSARVVTPLIFVFLIFWKRRDIFLISGNKKKWIYFSFSIFLFFFATVLIQNIGRGSARASDIAIFNPTDQWKSIADRRYEAVLQGLPDFFSRIFSNKATYVTKQFISGYLSYFSPQFIFTQGAGEWTYGMIPGRGVLYLFESVFVCVFLISFIRGGIKKEEPLILLLFWVLIAAIPAALAKGPGYAANRVAVMMPAIQIISSLGGIYLASFLSRFIAKEIVIGLYIFLIFSSSTYFFEDYKYHAPLHGSASMLYGRKEALLFIDKIQNDYEKVIISRSLSEPHIYVAFYEKVNPEIYQKESSDWLRYENENKSFIDQLGLYKLGKYVFSDINYFSRKDEKNTLLVGSPRDFPDDVKFLKRVNYPTGEPAILIVSIKDKEYVQAN